MKKTSMQGVFFAFLLSFFFIGMRPVCYGQNQQLVEMVELLQSMTPISMGMMGEVTDITISRGELVMTSSVDESMVNIKKLQENPELLKENMNQMILDKGSSIHFLIDELKDSGLGLRLKYIGKTSGETVSCALTSEELKNADYEDNDPDKFLEVQIRVTNAQLPMDYGNGMVNTKVVREGNNVVYYFVCEEPTYDIDLMQRNIPLMRDMILEQVNSNDASLSMFRQVCKNAGCGISYYYVGKTSGKIAKLIIPVSELK